ncbi:hypothetical protein EVAR_10441_1 [Eumeta japonica]|uniref:Uncharacterized protein n=1 Tax=Eumeta variegata TaxID=151549 RepID=A0A4C1TIC1_EUMVA|nr:hypothetical protein EVAR_10441_1 [Eumeta japonica]
MLVVALHLMQRKYPKVHRQAVDDYQRQHLKYISRLQVNIGANTLKSIEYHMYNMNEIMKDTELKDVYDLGILKPFLD